MAYREILQVGNSYNVPTKTFFLTPTDGQTKAQALATLPVNIPGGSVCELVSEDGLEVYMLRKTSETEGTWVLI